MQYLSVALSLAAAIPIGPQASARALRQLPDSLVLPARPDSLARLDSLARPDSTLSARRDSLDLLGKSSLEQPAFSTAKDSIITDFSGGNRKIYYRLHRV